MSLKDTRLENAKKYRTEKQTAKDLPVGTYVEVIVPMRDFSFFNHQRGEVIRSSDEYLGMKVRFDKKYRMPDFNFKPEDLYKLGERVTVRINK